MTLLCVKHRPQQPRNVPENVKVKISNRLLNKNVYNTKEKYKMMVNKSTNINKTHNYLSPQIIGNTIPRHMPMEIQDLA
jgi:hypothetical protein